VEYSLTLWNTISAEELEEVLQRASRTGYKLVNLLNGILDVRRIDADAGFTTEAVSVHETLDAALQLIDPRDSAPNQRTIALQIPKDLAVMAEPIRLQQVITNLISNAIKYSPPATPIEVRAEVVQDTTSQDVGRWRKRTLTTTIEMVELTVRDYGHGVPPDQQSLLFQRFARLPRDLASPVRGNGLGLYLCRVMITAMGGRIWLESSGIPGEGSMFHIRLPHAVAPTAVAAAAS
jgi:signal transduction histidine kinase